MGTEKCSPGIFAVAGFKRVVFGLVEDYDKFIVYHSHLHGRDATRAYFLVHRGPLPRILGTPRKDKTSVVKRMGTDYGKNTEQKNDQAWEGYKRACAGHEQLLSGEYVCGKQLSVRNQEAGCR